MRLALESVHAKHALVLALALAGAMPYGWRAVASTACGGGIQIVNLAGLSRSVDLIARRATRHEGAGMRALLFLRFTGVVAAVGAALLALRVPVIPFVAGLSAVVPAVLWHGAAATRARRGQEL